MVPALVMFVGAAVVAEEEAATATAAEGSSVFGFSGDTTKLLFLLADDFGSGVGWPAV